MRYCRLFLFVRRSTGYIEGIRHRSVGHDYTCVRKTNTERACTMMKRTGKEEIYGHWSNEQPYYHEYADIEDAVLNRLLGGETEEGKAEDGA